MGVPKHLQHEVILKPCPFCGSETVSVAGVDTIDGKDWYDVRCPKDCQAGGPMALSATDAAKAWNKRK